MSIGIFELVNGVLTKKKIAGKTLMDAQLNANSRNGVQNRIITGEINDIKDDISTISTQLSDVPTIESGSVTVSNIATGELRYIDVTFTKTFATVPNIILTEKGVFGDQTFGEVSASKTGFRLFTKNDANQTVSYALNWVAVS